MRRLLLAALLFAACNRDKELASGHIVVRDASGGVTRELRAMPYGFLGKPDNLRIAIAGGAIDAGPLRYENGKLSEGGQVRASVERKEDRIVVYDPARAPLGQVVARDGETWVYDGGGTPLGRAKADKDRVLLLDRDGGTKGFATGITQHGAAAFLLGGNLTETEKAVLALGLR